MARRDIRSEISGTVISVEATKGAIVAEGDVIAVVEAMKMEIPLVASASGEILEIRVAEGDVIAENAIVAAIGSA